MRSRSVAPNCDKATPAGLLKHRHRPRTQCQPRFDRPHASRARPCSRIRTSTSVQTSPLRTFYACQHSCAQPGAGSSRRLTPRSLASPRLRPPPPNLPGYPGNIGSLRSTWFRNAAHATNPQTRALRSRKSSGKSHRAAGASGAHIARLQHRRARRPAAVRPVAVRQDPGQASRLSLGRRYQPRSLARAAHRESPDPCPEASGLWWPSARTPDSPAFLALHIAPGNRRDREKQDRRESDQLLLQLRSKVRNFSGPPSPQN